MMCPLRVVTRRARRVFQSTASGARKRYKNQFNAPNWFFRINNKRSAAARVADHLVGDDARDVVLFGQLGQTR